MTRLHLEIPGELSPTQVGVLEDYLQHAVQSALGTHCDIQHGTVTLDRDDARIAGYAIMLAVRVHEALGDTLGLAPLRHHQRLRDLASRLLETGTPWLQRRTIRSEANRLRRMQSGGGFRAE